MFFTFQKCFSLLSVYSFLSYVCVASGRNVCSLLVGFSAIINSTAGECRGAFGRWARIINSTAGGCRGVVAGRWDGAPAESAGAFTGPAIIDSRAGGWLAGGIELIGWSIYWPGE